uniref:PH domain-containing protein n=1 Tax=Globodera pallida TaxID=36090 RepID=A0A183CU46_GLOPA
MFDGNPNNFAFYFADFKCYNPGNKPHYVTIVACKRSRAEQIRWAAELHQLQQRNLVLRLRAVLGEGRGGQLDAGISAHGLGRTSDAAKLLISAVNAIYQE